MEDGGRRQLSIAPDWEFPEQIDITIGNRDVWDIMEGGPAGQRTGLFRIIDLLGFPAPREVWWEDYPLTNPLCYQLQEQREPTATDFPPYHMGYLLIGFQGPDAIQVQLFPVKWDDDTPLGTGSLPPTKYNEGNYTLEEPFYPQVYFR